MAKVLLLMLVAAWVPAGGEPSLVERGLHPGEPSMAHALMVEAQGKRRRPGKKGPRRGRPVNLSRCLDSAVAGGQVFNAFCSDIEDSRIRAACRSKALESEQSRRNFCSNYFAR